MGALWPALRAPTPRESAFIGNGVQICQKPRATARNAFLQPWEVPTGRGEVSSPICISFLHPSPPTFCVLRGLSPSFSPSDASSLCLVLFCLLVLVNTCHSSLSVSPPCPCFLAVCSNLPCLSLFPPLIPHPAPPFPHRACLRGSPSCWSVLSAWLHLCGSTHGPGSSEFFVK